MALPAELGSLPGFAGIDACTVLRGERPGASVQLDDTYFEGQLLALDGVDGTAAEKRRSILRNSRDLYDDIHIDIGELTERSLLEASERYWRTLRQVPEITYLEQNFPETVTVAPEWLRIGGELKYGARVYFFGPDGPDALTVVRKNVEAVLADEPATFERYQGGLHGYPDCCVDFFHERDAETAPEWRSVEPYADRVDDAALERGPDARLDDIVAGLDDAFATGDGEDFPVESFFAREFFPEPGCERARERGRRVRDCLTDVFPDALVRDYFGLAFGFSYLSATAVREGGDRRPSPGAFGREHRLFYLPLGYLQRLDQYGSAERT
ncbi:MAG: hypothetical protein ABEJ74_01635 [Haloferacaceae archaeon]